MRGVFSIKICTICEETKLFADYYSQEKVKKNGEKYTYYHPYCKECAIRKSRQRQLDNHEEYKAYTRAHHKYNRKYNKKMIEYDRKHAKEQKESGYTKEYYERNKEYFSDYQRNRAAHKTHEITEIEWDNCKEYFNHQCAYCGLHIDEHYITYAGEPKKTDFHKEHVDHNGSNKIDNCVPACQSCNCKKWAFEFTDWYNEENSTFKQDRLNKINKWLVEDHKKYIKKEGKLIPSQTSVGGFGFDY